MSSTVGRYAPSPSGRMHLGNLCCCLLAWLSAKSRGGKVVLRIEDLDAVRCPREFADLLEADLAWLGLAADEGGSKGGPRGPYYQSERSAIYEEYYQKLVRKGLVYPCFCSRSQLHAADAPHRSDGKVVYAGTCRNLTPEEIVLRTARRKPAWRVMVPDETISFVDGHMGPYAENLAQDCGDFYLRRADGVFAYQLAVVVDDALMGCMVPKLVLQPIVENAVIHGVRDMDDGYIKIWAEADAGDLRLFVQDNGRGMEKPQDGPLGFGVSGRPGEHLGMFNVDSILRLHFGDAYGLSVRSRPGEGCLVMVRLPMRREKA